jgi:predicted kinase
MKKLIIVAGVAGSGKSYIGKEIAKRLDNCLYLDKDTQTRFLVDKFLKYLGHDETDRESQEYLQTIRPLEYKCLLKQGLENLELGKDCILSAPFIKEISEEDYFQNLSDELEFEDGMLKLIWIYTDEESARKRIIDRNAKRDENKINNWNDYVKNVNHNKPDLDMDIFIIDNRLESEEDILSQLDKAIKFIKKD